MECNVIHPQRSKVQALEKGFVIFRGPVHDQVEEPESDK